MLRKLLFLLPVCASVLPGCMTTPPLSEATGEEHSEIMIKDVVQRVKCELSEAFDKKVEQREFLWLTGWTAHADLTLTVNDTAGVSPNGGYTKYQGKTSTSAASPLASVVSTFTLSANANLSGQAVRTETVSFTVALDELKMWRTQLDKMEAGLPPEKKSCNFGGALGVTGNLGLHEWVDSAFYPVTEGQLQAGIHPAPGAGKPSAAQGPKSSSQAKSFETGTDAEKIAKVVKWQRELKDLQKSTAQYSAAVETASQKINAASTDLKNKVSDAKQFRFVMAPYLQARYGKVSDTLKVYRDSAQNCSAFKSKLDDAAKLADSILSSAGTTNTLSSRAAVEYGELETLMTTVIERSTFETDYAGCASKLQAQAESATILPKALPDQVDPPIDSVSHSLQFVVSYGVGISPSWTLLQWKGPGGSGNTPFFGASGTRTHTLNLALGPRSGTASISNDALRLINNQVIRSLGN